MNPSELWPLRCLSLKKSLEEEFTVQMTWRSSQDVQFDCPIVAGVDKHEYALRLCANPMYPEVWPDLSVWHPSVLPRKPSGTMNEVGWSSDWHTVSPGPDGRVRICHSHPGQWDANCTYVQVMLSGVLWCTAYEVHLMTGETIACILNRLAELERNEKEAQP